MKRCTIHFFTGIFCLILTNSYSQDREEYISHPDTLRIELPDGQAIDFAFEDIKNAEFDTTFKTSWLQSIIKIQAVVGLKSLNQPVRVLLVNKRVENELKDIVEIKELDPRNNFYMTTNGTLQDVAKFNQVIFQLEHTKVKIRLADLSYLEKLISFDFSELQEKLKTKKQATSMDSRKAYYLSTTYNSNSFSDFKISDDGVADFIDLTGGIGFGLFRDKLAPEISLNVRIRIRDKHGIESHRFGVQPSFHYLFDRNPDKSYNMNINTFVTAFYKRNFSKSTLNDRWAGIGVGYLVKESGGYFGKNTFKVGLFLNARQSSFDIIPEIIITDNFKTVFPSVRVGLTF